MINLAITMGNNPQNINKFRSSILFANGPIDPKHEAPTTPPTAIGIPKYRIVSSLDQAHMSIAKGVAILQFIVQELYKIDDQIDLYIIYKLATLFRIFEFYASYCTYVAPNTKLKSVEKNMKRQAHVAIPSGYLEPADRKTNIIKQAFTINIFIYILQPHYSNNCTILYLLYQSLWQKNFLPFWQTKHYVWSQ